MNLSGWSDEDRTALTRFYGSGNAWTWNDMEQGEDAAALFTRGWIEASNPPKNTPILLPRHIPESNTTYWYALAFNEPQAESLRENLMAFIGFAGTDFNGRRAVLDETDEGERILLDWMGGQWTYRFSPISSQKKEVRSALTRLRDVWKIKPELKSSSVRTTETLIREFFLALANGNEIHADSIIEELKAGGRLSAENLVFLEIEKLGAFQYWGALTSHSQLTYLKSMRRPRNVTVLLLEAFWRIELADFAEKGDVEGIIEYYRSDFGPRYQNFLKSWPNSSNESVLLTFLLASVADETPRQAQIPKLLTMLEGSSCLEFAQALADTAVPESKETKKEVDESPIDCALRAFNEHDYDTTWDCLKDAPLTQKSWELILQCADEFITPESALLVLRRFEELDDEAQVKVIATNRLRRAWERVQELVQDSPASIPSNWEEWFKCLDEDFNSDSQLQIARESSDWDVGVYESSPTRVSQIAELLERDWPKNAKHILNLSFPHLLTFFLKEGSGAREFLPIYQGLLEVLVLGDSSFSSEDWNTTESLVSAVLEAGLDDSQYSDLLEHLHALWDEHGSIVKIGWALDTLDLLAVHPCKNADALKQFYGSVVNRFTVDSRRIRTDQWKMLRLLSNDLGFSGCFEAIDPKLKEVVEEDFGVDFSGKLIAIYTLTESAGTRAKSVLESMFPSAKVRVSNDHGGSDKLKVLARDSDYFVLVTRSAKHAATNFIKDNRGQERTDLIYPSGKGSSSIVSALLNSLNVAA